jgi:hypothetical protein
MSQFGVPPPQVATPAAHPAAPTIQVADLKIMVDFIVNSVDFQRSVRTVQTVSKLQEIFEKLPKDAPPGQEEKKE